MSAQNKTYGEQKVSSPFFIVGCGRSGTTLLRTMLNRHSQIGIPLESMFIVDYLRAKEHLAHNRLIKLLVREFELSEWGMQVDESNLSEAANAREAIEKLHEIFLAKTGKQIWGQKTPRFVRYGQLLKRAWPNAKFVHIVRDPRAVVSSLIRSDQHRSNAYFGARRWLKDVTAGLDLQQQFPGDVMLVQYEDLVREPEQTLQRVCEHLGVAYEPGVAAAEGNETKEYGSWYTNAHALLNRPPDPDRIDHWRKQLTPRQLRLVEHVCSDTMSQLGYEPNETPTTIDTPYVAALKAERAIGFMSQVIKTTRDRHGYMSSVMRRKLMIRGLTNSVREGLY
jgi:LPS sulfotransferase NodH